MATLSALIQNPNSFHPTSKVSVELSYSSRSLILANCSLHLFYRLPPSLFVDPYELAQRRQSYTFVKHGHADLEKPVHAVEGSDVHVLVSIELHQTSFDEREKTLGLDIEVPLHARYGAPVRSSTIDKSTGNYHDIEVDAPKAFMTCPPGATVSKQDQETPDYIPQSHLREINFAPETTFLHIPYSDRSSDNHTDIVRIPVGHVGDLPLVQSGTVVVVVLCFFWVTAVVVRAADRLNTRMGSTRKRE